MKATVTVQMLLCDKIRLLTGKLCEWCLYWAAECRIALLWFAVDECT